VKKKQLRPAGTGQHLRREKNPQKTSLLPLREGAGRVKKRVIKGLSKGLQEKSETKKDRTFLKGKKKKLKLVTGKQQ